MSYVNQRDAIDRAKKILRHDNVRIVRRNGRYAFVSDVKYYGKDRVITKSSVLCVATELDELLTELLQIKVVAFVEAHSFNIPEEAMFHELANLYLMAQTDDEAISLFVRAYGVKPKVEVIPSDTPSELQNIDLVVKLDEDVSNV